MSTSKSGARHGAIDSGFRVGFGSSDPGGECLTRPYCPLWESCSPRDDGVFTLSDTKPPKRRIVAQLFQETLAGRPQAANGSVHLAG